MRALLVLLLLLPTVSAATEGGFTLLSPEPVVVDAGGEATLTFSLQAYDVPDQYRAQATLRLPSSSNWAATVEPTSVIVPPGAVREFTVKVMAAENPAPRQVAVSLEVLLWKDTDAPIQLVESTTASSGRTHLVLDRFENPLPAPMDGALGLFVLNVSAWIVIGLAVVLVVRPLVKLATRQIKGDLDDRILKIVERPAVILLVLWGVTDSPTVFALPAWAFTLLENLWAASLTLVVVYVVYRLWHEVVLAVGKRMTRKTESQLDDRLLPVFEKVGGIIILLAGIFYFLDSLGANLTYFAAGGVLVSMVIAFAAQDTLSNFFAGIHLMLDRPFKEGDDIVLDTGEVCTVTKVGLRSTDLYHVANHETIIVPNSQLATKRVINLLRPDKLYKVKVNVGVAYGSDIDLVKKTLLDIARDHPLTLKDPDHAPFVRFTNFGASSLDFTVTAWVGDVYTRWAAASDMREAVDAAFRRLGIEIPFPQHVIWQGREEAMRTAAEHAGDPPHEAPSSHATSADEARRQGADD